MQAKIAPAQLLDIPPSAFSAIDSRSHTSSGLLGEKAEEIMNDIAYCETKRVDENGWGDNVVRPALEWETYARPAFFKIVNM